MSETPAASVVVGVDYSECSTHAFACALALGPRLGGEILAVHVIPSERQIVDASDIWRSGDDATKREQQRLEQHVTALAPQAAAQVHIRVAWGEPASALARIIDECSAALLFLGRSGTSGGGADGLGAVARRLIAEAPCPVVLSAPRPATLAEGVASATTVGALMHPTPVAVRQSDTLGQAQRIMTEAGVHQLPVVDDGELIGIVALVDLERQSGYLDRTKVDAVMTQSPVTIADTDPLDKAIGVLLDANVNALPVMREDTLVGILSKTDILRFAGRLLASR